MRHEAMRHKPMRHQAMRQQAMRRLRPLLSSLVLLAACDPLGEPSAPSPESKPCNSDDDCEIRGTSASVRESTCSSRAAAVGQGSRDVDSAACGPMGNMSPKIAEPQLLCFRGTCVSVGNRR